MLNNLLVVLFLGGVAQPTFAIEDDVYKYQVKKDKFGNTWIKEPGKAPLIIGGEHTTYAGEVYDSNPFEVLEPMDDEGGEGAVFEVSIPNPKHSENAELII